MGFLVLMAVIVFLLTGFSFMIASELSELVPPTHEIKEFIVFTTVFVVPQAILYPMIFGYIRTFTPEIWSEITSSLDYLFGDIVENFNFLVLDWLFSAPA